MFHSYRILLERLYFVARIENHSFRKGDVRNRVIASTYKSTKTKHNEI